MFQHCRDHLGFRVIFLVPDRLYERERERERRERERERERFCTVGTIEEYLNAQWLSRTKVAVYDKPYT